MKKKITNIDKKETYTKVFLKAADEKFNSSKIDQLKKEWWYNIRSTEQSGLRLTEIGFEYVANKSQIKTYKIEFPKEFTVTPQILLWLDKFIDSPYYIDKKSITVLKEKSAFELYLFSGDIRKFGYSKALAKRFSQN